MQMTLIWSLTNCLMTYLAKREVLTDAGTIYKKSEACY